RQTDRPGSEPVPEESGQTPSGKSRGEAELKDEVKEKQPLGLKTAEPRGSVFELGRKGGNEKTRWIKTTPVPV
ncbi:MAG: hypothetical protein ABI977_13190, partial [Acidobacteriota bacterium]